jgi:hypothetical protein
VSASVRAKLAAAAEYLRVAPTVVRIVRDLALPTLEEAGARLQAVEGDSRAELERLAVEWNLGSSVKRLLAALDQR